MATLNGATITQGSTRPFTLTLTNPTEDHALNPEGSQPDGSDSGFNTPNYQLRFVAKLNKSDADSNSTTIDLANSRFTVAADGQTATFSLLPSDTNNIAITSSKTYLYEAWIEDSAAPTVNSFNIESGTFTLAQAVRD